MKGTSITLSNKFRLFLVFAFKLGLMVVYEGVKLEMKYKLSLQSRELFEDNLIEHFCEIHSISSTAFVLLKNN